MLVLVINAGSSSLKYQLLDTDNEEVLAKGLCERIGIAEPRIKHQPAAKEAYSAVVEMPDHKAAVRHVLDCLTDANHGVIKSLDEIEAVGHRVVHGGERFAQSALISDSVKEAIKDCYPLAMLHNPANMTGILALEEALPEVPQVAVFDTAFHQTMPEEAYMYAIPYEYYKKYAIRRYGFHGTSHKFVAERAAELLERPLSQTNIITCHLGNGSSITAVKGGKSIDTSMGLTPLAGVPMGTRSGDIDPAIVSMLMEDEKLSVEEINNLLNKESGMLGISGVSSDFRDLAEAANEGNQQAQLALDMFAYSVKRYIGAYTAVMGSVHAIVFTAGVGENDSETRENICKGLQRLGVIIDKSLNDGLRGKEAVISSPESKVKVLVIPTNEELAIARDTAELARSSGKVVK
ncbi:MAG: acetate kinase [Eubacteriales bacterium]|nr:acetate kinase [Eubacteriales bacterium]